MAKEGIAIALSREVISVDREFLERLEKIRAKRILNNKPIKSIRALTKEMIKTNSFQLLEEELINFDDNMMRLNFNIKFDKNIRP